MVTGGLAVMKHLFRDQLSNTNLAARILETADRSGRYADAALYGQGLLDLGAATSPVGTTEIAMSATVNGGGTPLAGTGLVPGGALGERARPLARGAGNRGLRRPRGAVLVRPRRLRVGARR